MEPIFDSSNKGLKVNCNVLKQFTESFFLSPKNLNIDYHFFHFGLLFEYLHYKRNEKWNKEMFSPTRNIFRGSIDEFLIGSVQLGRNLEDEYDEQKADKYEPYYWRISKAVEYNRPPWAFYMFLGNIQGLFNGNRITVAKLKAYIALFPKDFLDKNKEKLQYAFNHFDERGFLLVINDEIELIKTGRGIYDEVLLGTA